MIERDRELFDLEQKLALVGQALSSDDAARLIADEFVEFGVSGKVWNKPEIVFALASWPVIERTVENFSVMELSQSICLVTYQSSKKSDDGQNEKRSLRSSIWRRTNDGWQIVFHQGTLTSLDQQPMKGGKS